MQKSNITSRAKERLKQGALCVLFALFASGVANPAQAAKPLTPEQIQVYQSANESQRVHFLIERAKRGQYELVEMLLHHFPLQGPHAASRTQFIQGLILEAKGNLTGAAEQYRAILADDPSLTLVRTQLAQTLQTLGEDDSAKHHLKLLEAAAPSEEAASNIRSIIDRIDQDRPFKVGGFISLAPSTNLNGGSSHTHAYSNNPAFSSNPNLALDAGSKKQSGVGLAAGLNFDYAKRLGNHWEAVFSGDVTGQVYADKNYNSASLSESIEMRYHVGQGYFGIGGVADQSIDPNASDLWGNGLSYHSFGPRVSMLQFTGAHDMVHASAVYEWRTYDGSPLLDGTAFLSDISWNHGFDSTFNVTVSGGYNKVDSERKPISYETYFGGLGFYKELPRGINLNANAQVRLSHFDEMDPIFFVTRQDQRYIGTVALTKRDWNIYGFAPSLSYTYIRNVSNIAAFDYDAHAVDFRLTKDF